MRLGYCICCGVRRNISGEMKHDFECIWYGTTDIDRLDPDTGERIKIFCPYTPKESQ